MTNLLTLLAQSVLVPVGLIAAGSTADTGIYEKTLGS